MPALTETQTDLLTQIRGLIDWLAAMPDAVGERHAEALMETVWGSIDELIDEDEALRVVATAIHAEQENQSCAWMDAWMAVPEAERRAWAEANPDTSVTDLDPAFWALVEQRLTAE